MKNKEVGALSTFKTKKRKRIENEDKDEVICKMARSDDQQREVIDIVIGEAEVARQPCQIQ